MDESSSTRFRTGRAIEITVQSGWLSRRIAPPCVSTRPLAIAGPDPDSILTADCSITRIYFSPKHNPTQSDDRYDHEGSSHDRKIRALSLRWNWSRCWSGMLKSGCRESLDVSRVPLIKGGQRGSGSWCKLLDKR